jgi:hypothetical protein
MSKASDHGDWTKPATMAIPKGGYFPDKVEQGRYGPIFPGRLRATDFQSSRRSFLVARKPSTSTLEPSRKPSPASRKPSQC